MSKVTMRVGESITVSGYTFTLNSVAAPLPDSDDGFIARVSVEESESE